MAQSKSSSSSSGGARSRSSSLGKSGPSQQLLLIELKQRILTALNKLADRDTQHIAVEDLERIAEALSPEGISLCLSCLYETDSEQKNAVRKECVKMFGTLASLHDDLLAPHLSKIVINIVRRLRDPDSSVRDACVDTMGTVAAKVSPITSSGNTTSGGDNVAPVVFAGPLGTFTKPLFDALSEQNRGVQVGAAMCLARVIDTFKNPSPGALQRLCPRIIKLLNSPTFTANAALLSVVASIVQAGGATSQQCLTTLIECVVDCLKSNDWATRKAASETLARMASSVGPSLVTFKLSVLEALEACRFDKVKPVRETVVQTMPVWEKIPSSEMVPDRNSAVKENDFIENYDCHLSVRKVEGFKEAADVLKRTSEVNSSSQPLDTGYEFGHARSTVNKIKERAPLTDKIANPDFFQKLEKKDAHDWQIDIALPATVQGSSKFNVPKSQPTLASKETNTSQEHNSLGDSISHGNIGFAKDRIQNSSIVIDNQNFEENVGLSCAKTKRSRSKITEADPWFDPALQQQEDGAVRQWTVGPGLGSTSSNSSTSCHSANSGNDLAFIRRQICQLESQQLDLLELLQVFHDLYDRFGLISKVPHSVSCILKEALSRKIHWEN